MSTKGHRNKEEWETALRCCCWLLSLALVFLFIWNSSQFSLFTLQVKSLLRWEIKANKCFMKTYGYLSCWSVNYPKSNKEQEKASSVKVARSIQQNQPSGQSKPGLKTRPCKTTSAAIKKIILPASLWLLTVLLYHRIIYFLKGHMFWVFLKVS